MKGIKLQFLPKNVFNWRRIFSGCLLLACLFILSTTPAVAGIKDDRYDGNIFVVYAGNGSLVPPKATLATALKEHKPALLVFYVDDSSDCKEYAIVVSKLQAFYGGVAEIIPINVDTIISKQSYEPTEPGYYYSGNVPQVVVFNQSGQVVLNKKGQVPFEQVDDKFRDVFDLLPRTESVELKRRSFNELNSELTQ
ncbi:thylakoid membrane photosystem I accumulation factor [Chlorogloeopsis sp. ULAP01]|uniref:thylakoid membrane photosystem I accumulation factor n=1 Tax=Chlorogloeopsis sp. ULAP01 TaxID=3056483 RepID=UPI0025AB4399|nr:thylakoid membrane photosystem I accumulation factor [Chlorogloeopsis sp. ULAP01]MDM9382766.1 thylakoid membrane photosystem I accumulation factor [Chlorogloeopsis sp. ULAP01]